MLLKSL